METSRVWLFHGYFIRSKAILDPDRDLCIVFTTAAVMAQGGVLNSGKPKGNQQE